MRYSRTKTRLPRPGSKSSKSGKIDTFSRGLTLGIGPKMANVFNFFFLGNIGRENVFDYNLERKNAFLSYKSNEFKKSKIDIFLKRLTHGFGLKMAVFHLLSLGIIGQKKSVLRYSRTIKHLSKLWKEKRSKDWDFFKGVNPWFVSKNDSFFTFFLGNIGQENVFYDILERKNAFLGYKNKKFKKSKNWHLSKGVNPLFWSKNGHFLNIFFRQYRPKKCLLWYSQNEKTPL